MLTWLFRPQCAACGDAVRGAAVRRVQLLARRARARVPALRAADRRAAPHVPALRCASRCRSIASSRRGGSAGSSRPRSAGSSSPARRTSPASSRRCGRRCSPRRPRRCGRRAGAAALAAAAAPRLRPHVAARAACVRGRRDRRLREPLLRRIRHAPAAEHAARIRAARERPRRLRGARHGAASQVVLVDDVVTTGSTLSAAATALREAGAREVIGVAIARAD